MGLPAVIRPLIARIRKPKSKSVWTRGENAAAKLMKHHGYRLLARNLRLGMGEIDLLCLDVQANCVVVVEVKARVRKSSATPNPEANITAAKQRKLRSLAKAISAREDCRGKGIRIDVVAVEFAPDVTKPIEIRHFKSAVGA
tara:strand:- start:20349 stop:20774 length:426 start_codon:yes stop_codon:yes gene_type:complete